jgi:UTP--glucose-1-phosphate uridylyltransferase
MSAKATAALGFMHMEVRTAVIPAAGRGTRFLPLTHAIPKELLPVGDVPALHLVIDEAIGAGIDHVVLVISDDKDAVRRYLQPDAEVIERVAASGRSALAARLASPMRAFTVSWAPIARAAANLSSARSTAITRRAPNTVAN